MIRRFLGELGLIDAVMLAATVGGGLWLVMVHVAAMNHGPALTLAVLTGVGVLIRIRRAGAPESVIEGKVLPPAAPRKEEETP